MDCPLTVAARPSSRRGEPSAAPFLNAEKKYVAPELVRVNHLANCALCHAASADRNEPLRGLMPTPGQPLPRDVYYDKARGSFIRADVTYLKQDFSVLHWVPDPNRWPDIQRFDYLIRLRELSAEEVEQLGRRGQAGGEKAASYPQREAVLWALRELTGADAGPAPEPWRRLLDEGSSKRER